MHRLIALIVVALLLAACGQPGAASPTASDAAPAPTTAVSGEPARLVVMAHDNFNVSEEVLAAFEQSAGATVEVLKAGDTGSTLNQAILSREAPLADVLFGVDNTFLSRALEADIFLPYASPHLDTLPDSLKLDPENRLLPVDFGYVLINYDKAALEAAGRTPPASIEELTQPEWRGQLVVQNPATSSPGLAFLLATIAHFGEEGDYTWRDFWRDLRANEV